MAASLALQNLKPDAFVTRWSYGSVESISALAVAANVPTAQLKRTNNLMSEHSLHSRDHLFVPGKMPARIFLLILSYTTAALLPFPSISGFPAHQGACCICMTTVPNHDLGPCSAVDNPTGLRGEFYFCPVIGRQFVVFQPDSVNERRPALDSATKQAAEEASFAKLAVLLSRGSYLLEGLQYSLVHHITASPACCMCVLYDVRARNHCGGVATPGSVSYSTLSSPPIWKC